MNFEWLKKSKNFDFNDEIKLPVSVVLVVIKSRLEFVNAFVLPSIIANNPTEIIIIDDENLTNQEKRNKGASLAVQKYLFICDDDVVMPSNHLATLCKFLDENNEFAFAYTDYQAIVMDPMTHSKGANYYQKSRKFNFEILKNHNYIDTCSLVRKELFPCFDPKIKRFQDWDLWLTMGFRGHKGLYVEETGIIKFYLDEGITSKNTSTEDSRNIILKKHALSGLSSISYIDSGKGFNLQEPIYQELVINNNNFEITIDLSDYVDVCRLKLNFLNLKPCKFNISNVLFFDDDEKTFSCDFKILNSQINNDYYIFESTDPEVIFELNYYAKYLKVYGQIFFNDLSTHTDLNSFLSKIFKYILRKIKG